MKELKYFLKALLITYTVVGGMLAVILVWVLPVVAAFRFLPEWAAMAFSLPWVVFGVSSFFALWATLDERKWL